MKNYAFLILLLTLSVLTGQAAADSGPQAASLVIEPHKACPLCGMYPARYPRFNCQIRFRDGSYEGFDSAVGLLVYMLFPDKTGMQPGPVAEIYFKDHLEQKWLAADKTFFVAGSQIMGPMGVEFLAVDSLSAAETVIKEEQGRDIIRFDQIDRQYMLRAAQSGWLHYLVKKLILE